jgi:hypothetical protein
MYCRRHDQNASAIDQMGDGIGAKASERLSDLRTRYTNAAIDKHLAVRAGQHSNVSTRPFKNADAVSQIVRNDGRGGRAILDKANKASRLGECFARRKPSTRCCVDRATDAAKAETSSR